MGLDRGECLKLEAIRLERPWLWHADTRQQSFDCPQLPWCLRHHDAFVRTSLCKIAFILSFSLLVAAAGGRTTPSAISVS